MFSCWWAAALEACLFCRRGVRRGRAGARPRPRASDDRRVHRRQPADRLPIGAPLRRPPGPRPTPVPAPSANHRPRHPPPPQATQRSAFQLAFSLLSITPADVTQSPADLILYVQSASPTQHNTQNAPSTHVPPQRPPFRSQVSAAVLHRRHATRSDDPVVGRVTWHQHENFIPPLRTRRIARRRSAGLAANPTRSLRRLFVPFSS